MHCTYFTSSEDDGMLVHRLTLDECLLGTENCQGHTLSTYPSAPADTGPAAHKPTDQYWSCCTCPFSRGNKQNEQQTAGSQERNALQTWTRKTGCELILDKARTDMIAKISHSISKI
jgi:hypothetical protein